ncbi:hypothetical protein ACS0TY_035154 [Phlomoides rotata]
MIACRSLFRVNLSAGESSITCCARSKPLLYFQNHKFWHSFSCELKMDARKGGGDGGGGKKRTNVTQTWRAVSTQPKGDGERAKLKNPLGEVHHAISSATSIAKCESSNSEILNEPVGPDTHLVIEGGKIDVSLDKNLTTPEKHRISMEIGASLMRFVKGKWGITQEKLDAENGIKIIFPTSRQEDSIIIEGNSVESVTQASEKIQSLIDKTVNSRDFDYSHFVSLPLAIHPELVKKLLNFQNTVLGIAASDQHSTASKVPVKLEGEKSDAQDKPNVISSNIPLASYHPKEPKNPASETSSKLAELGIEKSIFINPKTFHLTVLMLKLWNKERVKTAAEVLRSVSSKVMDALENRPVLIGLKGLDCMRGSLAKAYVVYAPVEEIGGEGRLLRACKVITDAFVEAGLVMEKDAQQQLKLHATLMNARHRKSKSRTRNVDSFDARPIFEKYGSEQWGEYPIRQADLSQRFVYDDKGYYHCCASIPFPESTEVD